jgi:putative spermidine/putrescine transport system substrate-binding protein
MQCEANKRSGYRFFRSVLAGLICACLSIGSGVAQERVSGTLKVGAYGGTFTAAQKKYVGDLFTQQTGMKVQYIDASATDLLAKLIASKGRKPPFDVVYLETDVRDSAVNLGVFGKLDPKLVTNLRFLYPEVLNQNGYGPGVSLYSVGIAYNVKKFAEAGIPPPKSWNDLWNPKLAGRVAIPDVTTSFGREFIIAAARLKGGDEKTPEQGIDYIAKIKAHSYFTSSAQVAAQFQSGDVWAAPWINARTWGMIDKGAPLRYVIPVEGGIGNVNTIDMAAGTEFPAEAQTYINLALSPLAQLGNATDNPLGPTNRLLAPVIREYPEMAQRFPASPEDLKKLYLVDWAAYFPHREKVVDLWNRAITGK